MERISRAIHVLHEVDADSSARWRGARVHPAARLFVTLLYMVLVVSFPRYHIAGLLSMGLYPVGLAVVDEVSVRRGLKQLRAVLLLLLLLGIANPFLDRSVVAVIGPVTVTGGMLSFGTLFLKGIFTVLAAWFLVTICGMEQICGALCSMHVPGGTVTVLYLTWRYLITFLKEIQKMTQAYRLRAPGQKGIRFRAWGSFAGMVLLRSIARAQVVYESMQLRGFHNAFYTERSSSVRGTYTAAYTVFWSVCLLVLRLFPVFRLVGGL